MAGPISRVPRGLSSLLELKGGLSNPSELADFVLPTLNLLDFYQTDKRERSVDSIVANQAVVFPSAKIGGTADSTVPADEVHICWHLHWEILLPAATTVLQLAPTIRPAGTVQTTILPNPSEVFGAQEFLVMPYLELPLFALPGTVFGFTVLRATTGAATFTFSLEKEFTRLKA